MLRGSYAGGSLAVTARRPCRRSGPSATLHARVQAPVPRGTLPDLVSAAAIRRAAPPPFAALLLLRASALLIAVAWQSAAEPSHFVAAPCFSIAMRGIGLLRLFVAYAAVLCLSLALSRGATPSRDIAFQSRRPANLGGALPSPCHASLCLRLAAHLKAKPSLPVSVHRRCMPRLCFAVASRCFAPQCRGRSWLLMAELPNASALQSVAGPSRGRSFPCCSFANRFTALLFLRRSRLSRAFPSRRRAKQISSFAALGLAGLLRRRAARGLALLFRRLPEQIKALPPQRPSPQRHRDALPSHANPLPPTASLVRRSAPPSPRYSGSEPSVHSKRPLPLLRHWPMPRNCP